MARDLVLRLPALTRRERKGVSSPVRHECARTSSDFQTRRKAIWREGRLHHQHWLRSKHANSSRILDLRSDEECGGRYYPRARKGTRTEEHPRELHQPWRDPPATSRGGTDVLTLQAKCECCRNCRMCWDSSRENNRHFIVLEARAD